MPDVELAVFSEREEQVSLIGTDTRNTCAEAHTCTVYLQLWWSEPACLLVECHTIYIIAHRIVAFQYAINGQAIGQSFEIGYISIAIVEFLAIRSPARECLKMVVGFENI